MAPDNAPDVQGGTKGLARAYGVAGSIEAARQARDQSLALLEAISDDEDRQVIAADISTLPL